MYHETRELETLGQKTQTVTNHYEIKGKSTKTKTTGSLPQDRNTGVFRVS